MKYLATITICAVACAVIASFFFIGSPSKERDRIADEIRITHLQAIQGNLLEYWKAKKTLPGNLAELNDDLRGISEPKDPRSGESYGYKKTNDVEFEICANFFFDNSYNKQTPNKFVSPATEAYPYYQYGAYGGEGENWSRKRGWHCFMRKIDKDFFKTNK